MNIYILDNDRHPLPEDILTLSKKANLISEKLPLPEKHEDVLELFRDKPSGVVALPGVWEDMFTVKVIQELQTLPQPFSTIVCDGNPDFPVLCSAFNAGLTGFLQQPLNTDMLNCVLKRAVEHCETEVEHLSKIRRLDEKEKALAKIHSGEETFIRERMLGRAFIDIFNRRGPFFTDQVRVLIVSSSEAQQKKLNAFLEKTPINTDAAASMKEAVKAATETSYNAVVSDSVLPDGTAIELAKKLRSDLRGEMPSVMVWTSSPDKLYELLAPEHFIDYVVLKPTPDAGLETILLNIVAGLYRQRRHHESPPEK